MINKWVWLGSNKTLFTKQVKGQIWPMSHSLPTPSPGCGTEHTSTNIPVHPDSPGGNKLACPWGLSGKPPPQSVSRLSRDSHMTQSGTC